MNLSDLDFVKEFAKCIVLSVVEGDSYMDFYDDDVMSKWNLTPEQFEIEMNKFVFVNHELVNCDLYDHFVDHFAVIKYNNVLYGFEYYETEYSLVEEVTDVYEVEERQITINTYDRKVKVV